MPISRPLRIPAGVLGIVLALMLFHGTGAWAQSAQGSLTVSITIVPSTNVVFLADGSTQVITFNDPDRSRMKELYFHLEPAHEIQNAQAVPPAPAGKKKDSPKLMAQQRRSR